ncbi:MAG: MBL fold metallo-hydrolase [Paludibacteraceae bacterium]|nr:MBL fold metallo-hydrolase [Paludibacteraceae bacterium]
MVNVERFVMRRFNENAYVLYDETGECVLVDCGCIEKEEYEQIVSFIETNELKVTRLICTHFHIDHILGNAFFAQRYGVRPEVNPNDKRLVTIIDYQAMALNFTFTDKVETGDLLFSLEDGSQIAFGNAVLTVMHTPGHSPGSICLYSEKERLLVSGDTLMKGTIGSTSVPGGRKKALARSVEKLLQLPAETVVYPGHGDCTTIGDELKNDLLAVTESGEEKVYKSVDI